MRAPHARSSFVSEWECDGTPQNFNDFAPGSAQDVKNTCEFVESSPSRHKTSMCTSLRATGITRHNFQNVKLPFLGLWLQVMAVEDTSPRTDGWREWMSDSGRIHIWSYDCSVNEVFFTQKCYKMTRQNDSRKPDRNKSKSVFESQSYHTDMTYWIRMNRSCRTPFDNEMCSILLGPHKRNIKIVYNFQPLLTHPT